jgi:pilus assembly protein CpaF
VDLPLTAIREQIRRGVDLVVHQERGEDGRRRIVEIAELTSGGDDGYELRSVAA